jgi:hypothetical protein
MSPLSTSETIALFTEVSVALTGFAGVASAFVTRDRELTPLDRVRMHSVIALSSSVLVGCLAFITAEFAEGAVSASVRWAGVAGFIASLIFLVVYFPKGRRAEVERGISLRQSVALQSASVLVLTILLYACVVARPNQQVWLAAAFSLQLLHCIWMFVRLLGRPT